MDQPEIAQQSDDPEQEPLQVDAESSSEDSWSIVRPVRSSWQTTLSFPLNEQATTMRLDWNDYELLHASIARELQVLPGDLYHVHHARYPPQDLFRAYVEPVLPQRATDIGPGSMERLVLLDVEFLSSRTILQPEVVRQAYKLVEPISRERLLRQLGLSKYCSSVQHRCLVWRNNALVPLSSTLMELYDGDYIRVALPPPGSDMDHIATRCLATAYYQGMTPDDVLDRHTMYMLGWYDYVVDPPNVPNTGDHEGGDDDVMLCAEARLTQLHSTTTSTTVENQCGEASGNTHCLPPPIGDPYFGETNEAKTLTSQMRSGRRERSNLNSEGDSNTTEHNWPRLI